MDLQRKLDLPRFTEGGIELACRGASRLHVRAARKNHPGGTASGDGKARVVQDVKDLGAELEAAALPQKGQCSVFDQREIHGAKVGAADDPPGGVAQESQRRNGKRAGVVEPL